MADYPTEWESDVVLTDGGTLHVRPIVPDDGDRLLALNARMSPDSLYFRFMSAPPKLTPERLAYFTEVDYVDRLALVGILGATLVAVARYDRVTDDTAEVAFLVDDAHQGRGIGTLLLEHLAAAARRHGITRFSADTLAQNRRMLGVFRDAGWEVSSERDSGVVTLSFPIGETDRSREAIRGRERAAETASVRRLLEPGSIAVIGASRQPGTIGHEVFRNLLDGEFAGPVYPVNPSAREVAGVEAFPDLANLPEPADLAVVTTPAATVAAVVDDCAAAGVHGLVVISAGFSETGEEGRRIEREIVDRVRAHGMRMIGPNCMGVVNTAPDVRMNATFAPFAPLPGPVAFLSQSGAFGIALLEWAARLELGLSSFISVGNKGDVSGNDLLQYWEGDDRTDVILLYLESFGNPRKFARIARRVARQKPIVAVKGGRTAAGSRAASSHTAAAASPDVAVDALFRQTGVIRVDTVGQLFDTAQLLAFQPLPRGPGVAIVSNGGGPGILAADACEQAGLEVPPLSETTQDRLRELLTSGAAVGNPVDLVASASAENYRAAIEIIRADENVDALVVQFVPPMITRTDDVVAAIAEAAGGDVPVAVVLLATQDVPEGARRARGAPVDLPVYRAPEEAVLALARAWEHSAWRARPEGEVPALADVDAGAARRVVETSLTDDPEGAWLDSDAAAALLSAYGIDVVPTRRAADADEAVSAADALGYPAVMKAGDPSVVHKTDVGGVAVGLSDAAEVEETFRRLADAGLADRGVVVQPMVEGVEVIAGLVHDPSFGPLVMFGLGGVATELVGDRSFRIVPVTDTDAAEQVRSLRGSPLLTGYRGSTPCDLPALESLLMRLGRLAEDLPEIAEADLNPVMAAPDGAVTVDAKVRVAPPPPREPDVRRLRRS